MASAYLYKTLGTPTNDKKYTFSTWVKRAMESTEEVLISGGTSGSNGDFLVFRSTDQLEWQMYHGTNTGILKTDRLFRDPAAWYHIVITYDSANAVAGDRMKMYVNGVEETSFATDTNPPQDTASYINSAVQNNIGYDTYGLATSAYFGGVMAHTQLCDGQAYAASDFGETDATSGIWVPNTSPSVTYGNNGFFLKYASGASGTDSSGNSNDFTVSGTLTQTQDTPNNNFSTINPISYHVTTSLGSLANGNTTFTSVSSGHWGCFVPTLGADTGKWYIEGKVAAGADISLGVVSMADAGINASTSWYIGQHTTDTGYQNSGDYYVGGSSTGGWSTFTSGDIMGMALDLDNRKIYFHKNGVYEGSGDPVAGTNGLTVTADDIMGFAFGGYNGGSWNINYGNGYFGTTAVSTGNQDDAGEGDFEYDVPAGYYTLCTTNLGDQS